MYLITVSREKKREKKRDWQKAAVRHTDRQKLKKIEINSGKERGGNRNRDRNNKKHSENADTSTSVTFDM